MVHAAKDGRLGAARAVVLASHPLNQLWPVSTRDVPAVFAPRHSGQTMFQENLQRAVEACPERAPIIFTSAASFGEAWRQSTAILNEEPVFILVEPTLSVSMQAVLAAVFAAKYNRRDRLVFVPANTETTDKSELKRAIDALAQDRSDQIKSPSFLVRRTKPQDAISTSFLLNAKPVRPGWQSVDRLFNPLYDSNDPDDLDGLVVTPIGPASVRACDLLSNVGSYAPITLRACNNALAASENPDENIIVPRGGFLRLGGEFELAELMMASGHALQAHLVSTSIGLVTNWDDPLADPAAFSGARTDNDPDRQFSESHILSTGSDTKKVSGPDGVLFLKSGEAASVDFPAPEERLARQTRYMN